MTNRLHTATASPNWGRYDTLVNEALAAFGEDIVYAIQIVESARTISDKKRKTLKRNKPRP